MNTNNTVLYVISHMTKGHHAGFDTYTRLGIQNVNKLVRALVEGGANPLDIIVESTQQ